VSLVLCATVAIEVQRDASQVVVALSGSLKSCPGRTLEGIIEVELTTKPGLSVGLQGSYILTPDPDRLSNRRPSRLFSYFSYSAIQLYQDYYSASLGSRSAVNYRAELCMLLYNYGNTLIYLYLDLQSEYYQLSLHFIDPGLATDTGISDSHAWSDFPDGGSMNVWFRWNTTVSTGTCRGLNLDFKMDRLLENSR
jgi:hypothetical protein